MFSELQHCLHLLCVGCRQMQTLQTTAQSCCNSIKSILCIIVFCNQKSGFHVLDKVSRGQWSVVSVQEKGHRAPKNYRAARRHRATKSEHIKQIAEMLFPMKIVRQVLLLGGTSPANGHAIFSKNACSYQVSGYFALQNTFQCQWNCSIKVSCYLYKHVRYIVFKLDKGLLFFLSILTENVMGYHVNFKSQATCIAT